MTDFILLTALVLFAATTGFAYRVYETTLKTAMICGLYVACFFGGTADPQFFASDATFGALGMMFLLLPIIAIEFFGKNNFAVTNNVLLARTAFAGLSLYTSAPRTAEHELPKAA